MMFRQAAPHSTLHGRVTWGPFPTRWALVGMTAALIFLGPIFIALAFVHQHFHCDDVECSIDGRAAFARSAIRRVDAVIETGSKNAKYGVVVITLENGSTRRLMRVTPDEAYDAVRAIDIARTRGDVIDVELHGERWMAILGGVAVIAAFVFVVMAFARMGRFELVATPDGQSLDVRRTLFAIPIGTRRMSAARVVAVVVDRKVVAPPLAYRGEAPMPVARLVLEYRDGNREPLTEHFFPGEALHLRAAAALRTVLDLDPNKVDDDILARIPMRTTSMGNRIAYAWGGLTTGSLVGLALFGISMMLLHQITPRQDLEGWVVACGAIPGAIGGAAIVFHATRTRLPR
jgi:hypothetical protein